MLLGVNGIRLLGKRSGVGRAIEAILKCMDELEHPFTEIRVYTPKPIDDSVKLPKIATNVVIESSMGFGAWEQFTLPIAHGSKHLLLCPSYTVPILAQCPIFLIHHGSYEGYPQGYDWLTLNKARLIYTLSAKRANSLSTVSNYSRQDIAHFYGVKPEKIHVVPEGVDTKLFRPIDDQPCLSTWRKAIFGADLPFILFVGKPTKRHNLPSLIRAFGLLKQEQKIPHKLLLIGMSLPGTPFEQAITDMGIESEVFTIGHTSHANIVLAYNAANLLIYPSSYEGFGMPVLEAMACGRPVIAIDNTAFPEFSQGIAHLLPDVEVNTLKEGIMAVLSDPAWQSEMAKTGPPRAAQYDWHSVTQQYLDLMMPLIA
jgi:glycosyltransferase involved in cell wall biosynthesis